MGARVGQHKLGTRADKYKLGARAGKHKLGARPEGRGPSKGPVAGKYKYPLKLANMIIQKQSFRGVLSWSYNTKTGVQLIDLY